MIRVNSRPVSGRRRNAARFARVKRLGRPAKMAGLCAFTLLEIILALAILAGSLVALGEVMRLADQTAMLTEGETQAQIMAASLMDELLCGSRELSDVDQEMLELDADPPWVYSIATESTDLDQLIAVRIRVEQKVDPRLQPAYFEITRWMPNPDYTPAATTDDSESSTSTTESTSPVGGGQQ